ncbi:glutamine synthetase family protein [Mycolicibacterium palauense]|uniref:glutamine synthetase family protein n=1 Tax=Mycolicibacterium palauense TaxID=2034511 RepID=UPI0011453F42|nr:glutamine synthetase family protein [Mycolicibacterium palauense]
MEYLNLDGTHSSKVLAPAKFVKGVECGWNWPDLAFGLSLGNDVQFGFDWGSWRGELPDVTLKPDMRTLRHGQAGAPARVIADFYDNDGFRLPVCPRGLLRSVVDRLGGHGFTALVAVELEVTLFQESYLEATRLGYTGLTPLGGTSGAMLVMSKSADYHAFVNRLIERLDDLAVPWEAWSDEAAVGQLEINLIPTPALDAADHVMRAKQAIRDTAHELGHSATFMSKWDYAEYGQGAHVNLSLLDESGDNVFSSDGAPTPAMRRAVAGLLRTLPGFSSLAMPLPNSYRRLAELEGPPTTVTWGVDNKSCALRAVVAPGGSARLEHRLPGADSNSYLVLAGILGGICVGVEKELEPPQPVTGLAWMRPEGQLVRVPHNILEAAEAFEQDDMLRDVLGGQFVDYWVGTRRWEWRAFHESGATASSISKWETNRYFEQV